MRRKTDAVSFKPRPAAPVDILRNAVLELANGVEHGTRHEHRGGDRELAALDVALVLKCKDALERLDRRHPPRILDQDLAPPADTVGRATAGEPCFEPPPVRPAVAVEEGERLAPRCANPRIARRSRASFLNLDDTSARAHE